jgi:bifunctional DNase/RNase
LNEVDGERKLPIVIGAFEAQSIAIALEKRSPTSFDSIIQEFCRTI